MPGRFSSRPWPPVTRRHAPSCRATFANAPGVQEWVCHRRPSGYACKRGGTAPFNGGAIFNFAQTTVGFVPDVFGANIRCRRILPGRKSACNTTSCRYNATVSSRRGLSGCPAAQADRNHREMIDDNQAAVALVQRQQKAGFASQLDLSMQQINRTLVQVVYLLVNGKLVGIRTAPLLIQQKIL